MLVVCAWLLSTCAALVASTTPAHWTPAPNVRFHYQLGQLIKVLPGDLQPASANVTVYGIDGFDTSSTVVAGMVALGLKPVCYFSAGSGENWRPDYKQIPAAALGNNLDGWPGEVWLDIRSDAVRAVMAKRIQMCKDKGFVAIDPDNVDGYTNDSGFPLTYADQKSFLLFLASTAHSLGLAIGLKNDLDQIPDLVSQFDFAVNEQCWQYQECDKYKPFVNASKPVFNIEYTGTKTNFLTKVCPKAIALGIQSVKCGLDLKKTPRIPCPGA